jgi:hypothetical protein
VLCPVVGEAIVLGLDLLALAVCLRGRGMIQVRVERGVERRQDQRNEWMGVECPSWEAGGQVGNLDMAGLR